MNSARSSSARISRPIWRACATIIYLIRDGQIILHEDTDVLLSDYALLKMSEEQYAKVDRSYLLRVRKEPYGYRALCTHKQYYAENAPQIVIENGGIDDLITMMIRGEQR